MQSPGGQVVLSDTGALACCRAAGGSPAPLAGTFKVENKGFYRIELDGPSGERLPASPQYTIDALADRPPTVSIAKPGRDTQASPIEEVFVEARAEDDFGVRDLDLVYSVNGAAEKTMRLFDGKKRLAEVTGGTRSISRSSTSSLATSCRTTRRRSTTTALTVRSRR